MIPSLAVAVLAAALPVSPPFALDPGWDDGKAEVCVYATTPRRYDSRIVVRRKAEALEMIHTFAAVPDRRRMTALFDRKTFHLTSFDAEVADSTATRSMQGRVRGAKIEFVSEGRTISIPWGADAVLYETLPVWLRGFDLATPARFPVRMWVADASLVPAEIEVVGPAGRPSVTSRGGLEVDVHHAGKTDKLWFHPGPGHVLLVWERSDGTTLTLKKNERRIYQEKSD